MSRKCFVTTCTNTYKKTKNVCVIDERTCTLTTITYHTFPKEPDLRLKWIKATGRINWTPVNGSTFVCSEHFRESDYLIERRRRSQDSTENTTQLRRVLKKTAVPTQLLGSVVVAGDSEVYLKEDHYDSCAEESSDEPSYPNRTTSKINNSCPLPLVEVKTEPGLEKNGYDIQSSLTSTVTIKEESDSCDNFNGILEPEISLNISKSPLFGSKHKPEIDYEQPKVKRFKYEDELISPNDIKVERPSTPVDHRPDIEVKYERLLDQYLDLKKEYDLIKIKYEKQRDALKECEKILMQCR